MSLPGLVLAVVALLLRDPARGAHDEAPSPSPSPLSSSSSQPPPWAQVLAQIARNPRYVFATLGYVAVTFALGGIGDWLPTFLSRERGFSLGQAGTVAGLSVVAGGFVGTVAGGILSSTLARRARRTTRGEPFAPYFLVCGAACIPGVALAAFAIFEARGKVEIALALAGAQVFLWMYNGQVNTLLVNALDGGSRARAFGLALLATHLLGDVASPPIIGRVATLTASVAEGIGVAPPSPPSPPSSGSPARPSPRGAHAPRRRDRALGGSWRSTRRARRWLRCAAEKPMLVMTPRLRAASWSAAAAGARSKQTHEPRLESIPAPRSAVTSFGRGTAMKIHLEEGLDRRHAEAPSACVDAKASR